MSEEKSNIWVVMVEESKGILDPSVAYTFELVELNARENVIFSKDAPEEYRGKSLLEILNADNIPADIPKKWYSNLLEMEFKTVDEGLDVSLKESGWIDKLNINTTNPEYQSRIVTMIQRQGHVLEPGKPIDLREYFKVGMQFEAHVKPQIRKGKETGYHELDIDSMKALTGGEKARIQKVFDDVSSELKAKVLGYVAECTSKEDAMAQLVKVKKTNLMGAFLALIESGEISY